MRTGPRLEDEGRLVSSAFIAVLSIKGVGSDGADIGLSWIGVVFRLRFAFLAQSSCYFEPAWLVCARRLVVYVLEVSTCYDGAATEDVSCYPLLLQSI